MRRGGFSPLTWLAQMLRAPELHGQDKARLVGAAMLRYARADGSNAHPGRVRLAADLNVSTNTIDRALQRLVAAGWLVRVQSGSTSSIRNWADVYELRTPSTTVSARPVPDEPPPASIEHGRPSHSYQSPDPWGQSPNPLGQFPNDADHSPQPWAPNCLSPSAFSHLSDSGESGPPSGGHEIAPPSDAELEVEDIDQISAQVDCFEGYEESTAQGMLLSGSHPKAVLNMIRAQREGRR